MIIDGSCLGLLRVFFFVFFALIHDRPQHSECVALQQLSPRSRMLDVDSRNINLVWICHV